MSSSPDFIVEKWSAYRGDCFYGHHRIIVIYEAGEELLYFIVTSKIEKAEKRSLYDIASLVKIDPSEWDKLSCPSCVECSKRNLKQISKDWLKKLHDAWDAEYIGKVPETVRKRIIAAINASNTYNEHEKRKYTAN